MRRVRCGSALRAPTAALRFSSPQKSPPPGTACRAAAALACDARHRRCCKGVSGQFAVRLWGAEERRACGRARSAHPPLTCRVCLSAVSEANVASYAAGRKPSTAGESAHSVDRSSEALRPADRRAARSRPEPTSARRPRPVEILRRRRRRRRLSASSLQESELLALIGPNGAGKSTCFNLLNGQIRPQFRTRSLSASTRSPGAPARRIWRLGVGRTFQVTQSYASDERH